MFEFNIEVVLILIIYVDIKIILQVRDCSSFLRKVMFSFAIAFEMSLNMLCFLLDCLLNIFCMRRFKIFLKVWRTSYSFNDSKQRRMALFSRKKGSPRTCVIKYLASQWSQQVQDKFRLFFFFFFMYHF